MKKYVTSHETCFQAELFICAVCPLYLPFSLVWLVGLECLCLADVIIYDNMAAIRQLQHQRARRVQASARMDLAQPAVNGTVTATDEPVATATRLVTAATSVTVRRQWEANIERHLDAAEQLHREMREMPESTLDQ